MQELPHAARYTLLTTYLVHRYISSWGKLNYTTVGQERRVREMPEELSSIKIDLDLISSFPPQFCATTSVQCTLQVRESITIPVLECEKDVKNHQKNYLGIQ